MEVKPFSNDWIEGFVSEAADLGLSQEQAQALLKTASMLALAGDPDFMEGYQAEMTKAGAPVPPPSAAHGLAELGAGLKQLLFSTPTRAGFTGAAIPTLGYLGYKTIRPHWNMSPEQQRLYNELEYANPQDYESLARNWAADYEAKRVNEADAIKKRYAGLVGNTGWRPAYAVSPFW